MKREEAKEEKELAPSEEEKEEFKEVTIKELELESLRREAKEFKHKYLHLLADTENARKRLQKERQEIAKYAMESLLLEVLNPIDHLENALKFTEQSSEEVKHWAAGFKMILGQFKDLLANNGVTSIDSVGNLFDPHLHEAVEMVPTADHPPGIIVEEHLKGYRIGEKTLRPARVKVSKAPLGKEQPEEETPSGDKEVNI